MKRDIDALECQDGTEPMWCGHLSLQLGVREGFLGKERPSLAPEMSVDVSQATMAWEQVQGGSSEREGILRGKKQHREMPEGEGRVHWGVECSSVCLEHSVWGRREK